MNVTVYFLDDTFHVFQLQSKNLGQVLFEKVCKFINLVEVDYFGLEFEDDRKTKCWLDALKPLCSQTSSSFPTMYLCVKFYTPDPVQLEDEFTRYLFGLQVKKDLANGFLQCNENTAAVMVSYIVQADFGDFDPEKCEDGSYVSELKFLPSQDKELECKVMENHKRLTGQTPAEADMNLLETARRCELYGIKMTAAKDHEGVPLNLAVAHLGVLVFQNYTKINTFSWAKIRKLSFKRKKFLIKLHPEGYGYYKDTVEFFFEGRNDCKNFWKKCIENHTFFRCTDAKHGMRQRPKIFSRGSSFRYSGRTQKQVSEYVRENGVKRAPFQRSTSLKTPTSPSRSIGSPVSPQPLLPVANLPDESISNVSKEAAKQGDVSPIAKSTPAVTPGEDSRDDITYDNVSHDSYDVLERETLDTDETNSMAATNTRPNTSEDIEINETNLKDSRTNSMDATTNPNCMLTNNATQEQEICKNSEEDTNEGKYEDEGRRRSKRHRVRVYTNPTGQTSPTLYARANRHLCQEGSLKAYPRTVDFVLVNQLPAVGSFSYRDDSVEAKSPSQEILQRKRPNCDGLMSTVDLLGGHLPSSSAIKVVSDDVVENGPDCVPNNSSSKEEDLGLPPDNQNFHYPVYDDMTNGSDYVDRSSHYAYNSYKFSQIGRPPELFPADT
ncbi:hypothetical protein JTE90_000904 [Oedothorax gibbosus]|uniref:FERM domain-containing protein n=1 Tax=Oedothorax gibbosus TaxID=931172 RepID=A0AAV6VU39_9ARAC|nr:hypothetical protein JTE90_000904 [Oedothorax gibbosus]